MAYPTLAEAKSWIGTSGDDTVIQDILDGVIETVEQYTGRKFITNTATRNFPARVPYVSQGRMLLTFLDDLYSLTSITNGDGTVLTSADYDLIPVNGPPYYQIRLRPSSGYIFLEGSDGTKIAVVGSWSISTSCPADVYLAIIELVQLEYAGKLDGAGTTLTRTGQIIDKSQWPERILRVLNSRKRT